MNGMNGERKKKKCWKVFEAESRWINAIHPSGEWKRKRERERERERIFVSNESSSISTEPRQT